MARCGVCSAEFEGLQQEACPSCGAPRPRPVRRVVQPASETTDAPVARPATRGPAATPATDRAPEGVSEFVRITTVAPQDVPAFVEPADDPAARSTVIKTVVLSISIGGAILGVSFLVGRNPATTVGHRLIIASGLTILLYVLVALLVRRLLKTSRIRPDFGDAGDTKAILIGIVAGLGAGVLAVALNSLAAGGLASDKSMVLVLFEREWIHVGIFIVITAVAAPVVEELLFRGFLVESLRSRGRTGAVLGGAVAFSLWHLNPAALRYYVIAGFFLGFLYWRFGLFASITAHSVFNAVLSVAAFGVVSLAPQALVGSSGVTVQLPAGWHKTTAPASAGPNVDISAEAPTGSALLVQHADAPAGTFPGQFSLSALQSRLPPGAQEIHQVGIAEGTGLRFWITQEGIRIDSIITNRGSRVFVVVFVGGGSVRAATQFESILTTLTLPTF